MSAPPAYEEAIAIGHDEDREPLVQNGGGKYAVNSALHVYNAPSAPPYSLSDDDLLEAEAGGGSASFQTFKEDGVSFSEKAVRMGFIRRVYALLALQTMTTCGVIAMFLYVAPLREYTAQNQWVIWTCFGLVITTLLALMCAGDLRRRTPYNLIFLAVFTLAESFLVGAIAGRYDRMEVLIAFGICVVVVVAISIFAFQTKWDFTMMGGMLFVFLTVVICFGIVNIFIHNRVAQMAYAALGALAFCFYLVYDTQLLIGGNHKVALNPEEYVFGALSLYLDVINLFLVILSLVGGGRR